MFVIFTCSSYGIHISQGRFYTGANRTADWFHVVLNFIGPSDGVRIYHDTVEVKRDKSKTAGNFTHGDRRIVIGRRFSGSDKRYASVQVDELLFFNQKLTETEIKMLSKYRGVSNILFYYVLSKIFTLRKSSYGKVMFSQGGGVHPKQTSPGRHLLLGRHQPGQRSSGQTFSSRHPLGRHSTPRQPW